MDSLPPKVLDLLVRQAVSSYIDKKQMEAVIAEEVLIKTKLKGFTI